jgi:predicted acetyltransferase
LVDESRRILGAVNIRHRLTDNLRFEGGHVGYGVRPSARNKGHGTRILELALAKLGELGVDRVLVTCDRENLASARVIKKNGGVLDSETEIDGRTTQRYWIEQQ